jgi:hypothetical protein
VHTTSGLLSSIFENSTLKRFAVLEKFLLLLSADWTSATQRREQKYHVSIRGVSYGRCKKYWDDFEELYDSLELRYSNQLESVPFPTYVTRRDKTKKEAVENNRQNLEILLVSFPKIRTHMYISILHAPWLHVCTKMDRRKAQHKQVPFTKYVNLQSLEDGGVYTCLDS